MTALAALKRENVLIEMKTKSQLTFNGGRLVQIDVFPTGECMEEVYQCECITEDFLSHGRPSDFCLEEGRVIIFCDSGSFSFPVEYYDDCLKSIEKCISRRNFVFTKKGSGFSFVS